MGLSTLGPGRQHAFEYFPATGTVVDSRSARRHVTPPTADSTLYATRNRGQRNGAKWEASPNRRRRRQQQSSAPIKDLLKPSEKHQRVWKADSKSESSEWISNACVRCRRRMYWFNYSEWDGGTPSNRGPETTKVVERLNHQPLLHRRLVRTRRPLFAGCRTSYSFNINLAYSASGPSAVSYSQSLEAPRGSLRGHVSRMEPPLLLNIYSCVPVRPHRLALVANGTPPSNACSYAPTLFIQVSFCHAALGLQ